MTAREQADVVSGLSDLEVDVEPLTNYFAGRAFKELGSRAGIGLIGTATDRSFEQRRASTARSSATPGSGGVDGHWFLDGSREWVIRGSLAASHLRGDAGAILAVQRAAPRYFQRPDAPHVQLDPDRHLAVGLDGGRRAQPEQRQRDRQRAPVGHEPRLRDERSRVRDADRPRRRAWPRAVPQADARTRLPRAPAGGGKVVDVELRARVAGRRRAGGGEPAVPQLLAAEPHALELAEDARRQADARRADGDPARHPPDRDVARVRHTAAVRRAARGHVGAARLRRLDPERERGGRLPAVAWRVGLGRAEGPRHAQRRPVPAHRARSHRDGDIRVAVRLRRSAADRSCRSSRAST